MLRAPILPLLLLLCLRLCAQTTLSGNIGGMTLEQSGNPYLVTESITIQSGTTTTVKPGCVFLFKPFTALEVHGTLRAAGTRVAPVVFTSINDSLYNKKAEQPANPFDWNGITINNKALRVRLSDFQLSYSVYGIKTQQMGIVIEHGVFRQNGQYHFTVNDAVKQVQENIPFSYNADGKIKGDVVRKPHRPLKVVAMFAGVAGVGCMIAAVPFFVQATNANREGNTARFQTDIDAARSRESSAMVTASILTGSAGLLLPASIVLIVVDKRGEAKSKSVTIAPVIGTGKAGVRLSLRF